jgi:hypothetical protein
LQRLHIPEVALQKVSLQFLSKEHPKFDIVVAGVSVVTVIVVVSTRGTEVVVAVEDDVCVVVVVVAVVCLQELHRIGHCIASAKPITMLLHWTPVKSLQYCESTATPLHDAVVEVVLVVGQESHKLGHCILTSSLESEFSQNRTSVVLHTSASGTPWQSYVVVVGVVVVAL